LTRDTCTNVIALRPGRKIARPRQADQLVRGLFEAQTPSQRGREQQLPTICCDHPALTRQAAEVPRLAADMSEAAANGFLAELTVADVNDLVPWPATFEGRVDHLGFGVAQTSGMAERVQVRDLTNDEGRRLLAIIRRGSGSVVRWRRAQIVLWSAQRMNVPAIAKIAFTSEDRVRAVIHNFNEDGFDSLAPRYAGGRPPTFTLPQRREIKKVALSRPTDHDLPFSTWSLSKLAEFLVAEGVVDDISHEGLRLLVREEGVSFQAIKTFKVSNDPDFEAKKNRILELYDLADGKTEPGPGDPTVVVCFDEFGPLNL